MTERPLGRTGTAGRAAWASSSLIVDEDGERALSRALDETSDPGAPPTDLALFFASPAYDDLPSLVRHAYRESGASVLVGCSGQGIIGTAREVEGRPALSLLRLALPDTRLVGTRVTQTDMTGGGPRWPAREPGAWLVFADPFHLDVEDLLARFQARYPNSVVAGGLASGAPHDRSTTVFLNGETFQDGAVAVGIQGGARIVPVVSQGCTPIGETWTVTSTERNVLRTVGGRPAYEVLVETVTELPPSLRRRARGNLFVGLAMDEYRDTFRRGDFLIRNLTRADAEHGLLGVGATPRVGQTLQFQLRDREAADEDLRALLDQADEALGPTPPLAALLCVCNGRGTGLFEAPDHDAQALVDHFGPVPAAGFFCNGEIGPVGGKLFLHGYTASIALLAVDGEQPEFADL